MHPRFSKVSFITFFIATMLIASESSAQFQWGIGVSPGIGIAKVGEHQSDFRNPPQFSIAPQIFGGYSWYRKYSVFLKSVLPSYDVASKIEFQLLGSVRKSINKNVSLKSALGVGTFVFAFGRPDKLSCRHNIYLIAQVGPHFILPGKSHFLFLSLDYHYGLRQEYNYVVTTFFTPEAKNVVYGRGSYLALNIDIIFGKEKNPKRKTVPTKNFVM